ncbi:sensor histidine kinase [Pseudactinotalea sp. Z1732]|uniref:sensor histidine kinase n=1 Tax=Pseudactinotalea sp. Z1732 TaxID=3413026 RepID=UPI003C7A3787
MNTKAGRHGISVRTRVLGSLVFMAMLALAVAGLTAFYFERERVDAQIDDALERNVSEFHTLADQGLDPRTGAPFDSVAALLRTGLQRIAMSPNEGSLAFLEGELRNTAPTTVELRLEDDPELMAALGEILTAQAAAGAAGTTPQGRLTMIETSETTYRAAVVPVRIEGDESLGTLVMAFDRGAEHTAMADTYQLYALVGVVSLLVISAIGWFTVGRVLRPIRLLGETAESISSTDLSLRIPVVGNDDLAALTGTFNQMLERLEQAFASQRQLLDDAGHELRTPLTIVQGHLELMDPSDPGDARATKDVLLDEIGRMNRLVDDLMTLARARRPDFVAARPTDIAMLTDEVLGKARLLGERQWSLDSLAEVTAPVDPQRLTQALLQLCVNAVRFSEPGSRIAVGSRVEQSALHLWVRDEGSGIAEENFEKIFGRFERLDPAIEGSGLGLPIVRSITEAHGGHVTIRSALGQGTTVTLVLPLYGLTDQLDRTEQPA